MVVTKKLNIITVWLCLQGKHRLQSGFEMSSIILSQGGVASATIRTCTTIKICLNDKWVLSETYKF